MSYSRIPCAMPNSKTPIDGHLVFGRPWVAAAMNSSQAGYRDLVESLGGVWPNDSVWGSTGGGSGTRASGSGSAPGGRSVALAECLGVQLSAPPGAYTPPSPVLAQPIRIPVTSQQARAITMPVPARAIADSSMCDRVTADNVCELAVRGCFRAGQVDPAQLAACAAVGWQGNYNQFPALIARGGANGGAPVGLLNPNPAGPRGLSGLEPSSASSLMGWGAMALGCGLIAMVIKKGCK